MRIQCPQCRELMNVHAEVCPHCRSDVEGYGEILMESMRRAERRRSGEPPEQQSRKSELDLTDPDVRLFLIIISTVILFAICASILVWVIDDKKILHYLLMFAMSISCSKSMIERLVKK